MLVASNLELLYLSFGLLWGYQVGSEDVPNESFLGRPHLETKGQNFKTRHMRRLVQHSNSGPIFKATYAI